MSLNPHCPLCNHDDPLLDALMAWDGTSWVHECDTDDMFCPACEESFKYDELVWVGADE